MAINAHTSPQATTVENRRPDGSLPGYAYSDTVANLGFEWTEETVDQLFDLGPDHFIPGSKMPMQVIAEPDDRRDLIEFLKDNT